MTHALRGGFGRAHNPKVEGSNPSPATNSIKHLAQPWRWAFCFIKHGYLHNGPLRTCTRDAESSHSEVFSTSPEIHQVAKPTSDELARWVLGNATAGPRTRSSWLRGRPSSWPARKPSQPARSAKGCARPGSTCGSARATCAAATQGTSRFARRSWTALFKLIVSANTDPRTEGHFRLEWKLAVDRSHRAPSRPRNRGLRGLGFRPRGRRHCAA